MGNWDLRQTVRLTGFIWKKEVPWIMRGEVLGAHGDSEWSLFHPPDTTLGAGE
jgi:hypothetical protein